ncbi:thioredoxin family protein [Pseudothermotoga sp. U03pept]|uniref:thioredoxin family protein n=1 Tax=Pseudothermotoga sp. U03pept TaxID=3447012 RepID=UPI003F0C6156
MRSKSVFLILVVATVLLSQSILFSDLDVAVRLARIEQKKFAILFTTSTCPYCKKLKDETLTDKTVKQLIYANYIFAEALFDYGKKTSAFGKPMSYSELFSAFQVNSVPVTWFFTAEASPLVYLPGYLPASTFAQVLRYVYQEVEEDFQQYLKRKDDFQGERMILFVTDEEANFVLKNDPNSISVEALPQSVDPYKVYVTRKKDLGEELSKAGVFRVLVIKQD